MLTKGHYEDIWSEDFFTQLSRKYQVFYLYALSEAENSGVWIPKKNTFESRTKTKIDFDDFLQTINADCDPNFLRVAILKNGRWFFAEQFTLRMGYTFRNRYNAYKKPILSLLDNGIPLKTITGFQWQGLDELSESELRRLLSNENLKQILHNLNR